jgi:hypothetical protein
MVLSYQSQVLLLRVLRFAIGSSLLFASYFQGDWYIAPIGAFFIWQGFRQKPCSSSGCKKPY